MNLPIGRVVDKASTGAVRLNSNFLVTYRIVNGRRTQARRSDLGHRSVGGIIYRGISQAHRINGRYLPIGGVVNQGRHPGQRALRLLDVATSIVALTGAVAQRIDTSHYPASSIINCGGSFPLGVNHRHTSTGAVVSIAGRLVHRIAFRCHLAIAIVGGRGYLIGRIGYPRHTANIVIGVTAAIAQRIGGRSGPVRFVIYGRCC